MTNVFLAVKNVVKFAVTNFKPFSFLVKIDQKIPPKIHDIFHSPNFKISYLELLEPLSCNLF